MTDREPVPGVVVLIPSYSQNEDLPGTESRTPSSRLPGQGKQGAGS